MQPTQHPVQVTHQTAPRGGTPTVPQLGLCGLVLGLLAGCATTIRLDNDVRSFPAWGTQLPHAGDAYRFERLPSQAQDAAEQAEIETLAEEVLQDHGWVRVSSNDPTPVRWTVQLQARAATLPHAPWENPPPFGFPQGWLSIELGSRNKSAGVRAPLFLNPPTPYYQREITVVMRNAQNGAVVFETQAAHDGPWRHTVGMWRTLLEAALKDFPQPPQGKRRVAIEVPR
jgi:hypothetical protein